MRSWILALLLGACTEYSVTEFEIVDTYNQDPTEEVDILLVVDNSGSMLGYQFLLGARFPEFISAFVDADVDYHIGVVTTTIEPGFPNAECTQEDIDAVPPPGHLVGGRYITTESANAEEAFEDLVNVGACGSGLEEGLEAARIALSPELLEGPNFGFIREDAALSIIFVSDEQDFSPERVADYIGAFYDVKGQRARGIFNASAFVITDASECIVTAQGSSEGTRYMHVAEQTGGVIASLCADNFVDTVEQLSLNASRVRDTFYLSNFPDPSTLVVGVEDEIIPCSRGDWTYQVVDVEGEPTPAIVFDRTALPRSNARISVRYNRGGGDPLDECPEDAS